MVSNVLFYPSSSLTHTSDLRQHTHTHTHTPTHTHTHTPFPFLLLSCFFLLYVGNLTTQVSALGFQPGIHSRPVEPTLLHPSLLDILSPDLNLRKYACQGEG